MKKNILRVVALLLIVCVLAGFPLKAKASGTVALTVIGVAAASAVAASLIGLGTLPASDPTGFNSMVDRCVTDLGLGEVIQGVAWVSSGFQKWAAPYSLLESVRGWFFDDQASKLNTNFLLAHQVPDVSSYAEALSAARQCYKAFTGVNDEGVPFVLICNTYKSFVDGKLVFNHQDPCYTFTSGDTEWFSVSTNNGKIFYNLTQLQTYGTVSTSSDQYVLDNFPSESIALEDAYPSWIEGVVHVPESVVGDDSDDGDETIPYVPTGIGETYEETIAQTKEQVQTGETTIDVTVEIPDDTVAGTKLGAFFASLVAALSWSNIKTWIEGIWTSVLSIPNKIAELPTAIAEKFTAFWTSVTTWLEDLHAGVTSIPQAIADVLADIFIPAEDYISVKVEALAAEYAFVPDIVDSVTLLKNNLVGDGGPPVIYVDFGRAGGNTNYGGKVLLTDFAWYEEYKPTVDALLSAALWAFFLWRVFLKMPGIIGGESAAMGSAFTSYTRRGRDE